MLGIVRSVGMSMSTWTQTMYISWAVYYRWQPYAKHFVGGLQAVVVRPTSISLWITKSSTSNFDRTRLFIAHG